MLREKSKQRRRRAILDAASKMFTGRAYHDVLLEDIAAAAEVAKGTVYLYFENKEHLYLTLLHETLGPVLEDLHRRSLENDAQPAWDMLQSIVRTLLTFSAEHPALQEVLRVTTQASREAVMSGLHEQLVSMVEKTIERGIARGEFRDGDPTVITQMILGMVNKCGMLWPKNRTRASAEKLAEQMLQFIGRGMLPPKSK
jgi:AcrR family transcriptional regulator